MVATGGIAKTEFELTPYSGDHFLGIAEVVKKANVTALVDGAGMIYTSEGHNLTAQVSAARLNTFAEAHVGTSMCAVPQISGQDLVLPAGDLYLNGELLKLYGPETDGSQRFSLDGLKAGTYALVLESWNALVGVTTYGRATLPSFWAGVVSAQNKMGDTALYRAGNLAASEGQSDAALITGTIETQRMVQRQYVLRLIPDLDLRGSLASRSAPADRAGTVYAGAGDLVTAVSPYSSSSSDVALDRTFTACKLALVEVTESSATAKLYLNAPHLHRSAQGNGQNPIPVIPSLRRFQSFVTCEIERLDLSDAVLAKRISSIERLADGGAYLTSTPQPVLKGLEQRLFFTQDVRDPLGWHLTTSAPQRFVLDFSGTLQVILHAAFDASGADGALDGTRQVRALLNEEDTGVKVTQAAVGGAECALQLTAELDVTPGQALEFAILHTSPSAPTLNLAHARLTLRRLT